MKTATWPRSVNEPRLHASLFLRGRREPPLYSDMMHACGNRPTHAAHVTHTPPCRATRAKSLTTVKTAPPSRAPFWAWPNNVSRLCVAQARGLLSVYKKRGAFLYPYTCARAVGAAPTVTLSRTGEVSQGKTEAQDDQSNAKTKTTKSRGTKQVPPARPLPGQLAPHQQSEPPLSPRSPTPSSTWGQGSGRHLCGGMQIFVKTYSRSDED